MSNEKVRNSFVFYGTFRESISKLPKHMQYICLENLIDCCLGLKSVDELKTPYNALVNQMLYSVKKADARYEKAKERGRKGGRPEKKINREEAERLYKELGSWEAVATQIGVSYKSISRARKTWDKNIGQNGQNLNKNINTNIDIEKSISIISEGIAANSRAAALLSSIPKERVRSEPYVVDGSWFVDMIDDDGDEVSMRLGAVGDEE